MILRTENGDAHYEARDIFDGIDRIPVPSQATSSGLGGWTYAGRRVGVAEAAALPACMAAIRLLSETVGSLPLELYRGESLSARVIAGSEEWQHELLISGPPNDIGTQFDFRSFMVASLQGWGGAYALKVKGRVGGQRRVLALYPLDPNRITVKVDGQARTFQYRETAGAKAKTLTSDDVLYVPGYLVDNPFVGVSPIALHRHAIGTALASDEYAGRFYGNDATPPMVIQTDANLNEQQRKELRESWSARHRGTANAHIPGILWGGATIQSIGIPAADAQLLEARKYGVEDVARIFRVPARLIGGEDGGASRITPEMRNLEFVAFSLLPWLARIEQALHADDDLFPDKTLHLRHSTDELTRADMHSRWDANRLGRQGGWITANEIRAREGLPPVEGGDEIQMTPVGGAPNDNPNGGAAASQEDN